MVKNGLFTVEVDILVEYVRRKVLCSFEFRFDYNCGTRLGRRDSAV